MYMHNVSMSLTFDVSKPHRVTAPQEPRALGKQIKSLLPQEAILKQHKLQAAKVPGPGPC